MQNRIWMLRLAAFPLAVGLLFSQDACGQGCSSGSGRGGGLALSSGSLGGGFAGGNRFAGNGGAFMAGANPQVFAMAMQQMQRQNQMMQQQMLAMRQQMAMMQQQNQQLMAQLQQFQGAESPVQLASTGARRRGANVPLDLADLAEANLVPFSQVVADRKNQRR